MPLRAISWVLYIVGVALIAGGYFGLVSNSVSWIGWIIGMAGWAMQFLPAYRKEERGGPGVPMDESQFWKIIEDNRGDAEKVTKALSKLPPDQIAEFQKLYYEHHNRLHRWDIWGAGYVINGGCSDDGFHYFKSWIIGKGRKAYETALAAPDDLGQFVDKNECGSNESLEYAAHYAYEAVTGKSNETDYHSNENDVPAGTEWSEDEVYNLFPKLYERFG